MFIVRSDFGNWHDVLNKQSTINPSMYGCHSSSSISSFASAMHIILVANLINKLGTKQHLKAKGTIN